jgi:hypothetical protein
MIDITGEARQKDVNPVPCHKLIGLSEERQNSAKHGVFMNILNKADTLKKIGSIKKRSGVLREDIHAAALGAMCHAMDHGDFTLASKLTEAVSKPNAALLRRYFVEFMPVRWVKGTGFKKIKGKNAFDVTDAIDVYFDDMPGSESAIAAYNAMTDIKSLVNSIKARITKAEDANDAHMAGVYGELLVIAAR